MIKGRRGLMNNLRKNIPDNVSVVWFHASSLGEFEQGRPLIESWKKKCPDDFILLSFFSPSGYEIRKNFEFADHVCYLPFDRRNQINKFLSIVKPKMLVLIKYEFWPKLLLSLKNRSIPVYLISALFRPDQHFFKWYGGYFRRLLSVFSQIFVQDEVSKELLEGIDIDGVQVSGDTRIDCVLEIAEKDESIEGISEYTKDAFVLIGGSSWEPEEEMMSKFMKSVNIHKYKTKVKLILAPHNVREEHLLRIEELFGNRIVRYSNWLKKDDIRKDIGVLLIDQVGLLSRLYKYSDIAFIGGGFGAGLHNVIEPAAFGIPVIYGPKFDKFPEAVELQKYGGGFSVSSYEEFKEKCEYFMSDKKSLSTAGGASRGYVDNFKGASILITSWLMENVQH